MTQFRQYILRYFLWGLYGLLAFIPALLLSWLCLSKVNFLYPLWYNIIGIDITVAQYGPLNRNRKYFELTTKKERVRLFSKISKAIHSPGYNLEGLIYHNSLGQPIDRLLTPLEIVHLKDVTRLVRIALNNGWITFGLWLITTIVVITSKFRIPLLRYIILWVLSSLITCIGLIAILGAKTLFYRLHQWIFPKDHPWFFYYQDSLMTTMMKAPDLFGYIAVEWILSTVLIWILLLFTVKHIQKFYLSS